jgi:hypothetical protein
VIPALSVRPKIHDSSDHNFQSLKIYLMLQEPLSVNFLVLRNTDVFVVTQLLCFFCVRLLLTGKGAGVSLQTACTHHNTHFHLRKFIALCICMRCLQATAFHCTYLIIRSLNDCLTAKLPRSTSLPQIQWLLILTPTGPMTTYQNQTALE